MGSSPKGAPNARGVGKIAFFDRPRSLRFVKREYNSPRKRNFGVGIILTDRYFHIPLPIVTKHELGLPFPPRNLPIKFSTNPSTIFLVIVVTYERTHRQKDKSTPVKTYSHANNTHTYFLPRSSLPVHVRVSGRGSKFTLNSLQVSFGPMSERLERVI